ncbi:uncharacterized protein METZ01_LOCUS390401, partial [marine metagenome]
STYLWASNDRCDRSSDEIPRFLPAQGARSKKPARNFFGFGCFFEHAKNFA